MSKLLKYLLLLSTSFLVVLGYFGFQSYRAVTFMEHGLQWSWADRQFISLDSSAMQSARENQTKQLIYRRVDLEHQMAIFLNTTNNSNFLFTFIKEAPCDPKTPIQAQLTVNEKPVETVTFGCKTPNSAIYRIGEPSFSQLKLVEGDFQFDLDLNQWDINTLKKDDFMQLNHHFFQDLSSETVHPWTRD